MINFFAARAARAWRFAGMVVATRRASAAGGRPSAMETEVDTPIDDATVWEIVSAYFAQYGMVRHQTEAFNNFMLFTLPHIIQVAHRRHAASRCAWMRLSSSSPSLPPSPLPSVVLA